MHTDRLLNRLFLFSALCGTALYLASDAAKAFFVRLFQSLGATNPQAVWLSALAVLALVLPRLLSRPRWALRFFGLFAVVAGYFALSYWLNPAVRPYFWRPVHGIARVFRPEAGLFVCAFFWALGDSKNIDRALHLTAWVAFVHRLLQFVRAQKVGYFIIQNHRGVDVHASYNLDFGFGTAFACCLFIYLLFRHRHWFYALPALVAYGMVLFAGNRMGLMLPPFCLTLCLFQGKASRTRGFWPLTKLIVALLVTLIALYALLFGSLVGLSKMMTPPEEGLSLTSALTTDQDVELEAMEADSAPLMDDETGRSRNLELFAQQEFFDGNSRDHIYSLSFNATLKHPILGLGAFGDRPAVAPRYIWGYSHNFFLEVWSNLGLVLGLPFVAALFFCAFSLYFSSSAYGLMVAPFSAMACSLFTSHSFWYMPWVWALFALAALWRHEH